MNRVGVIGLSSVLALLVLAMIVVSLPLRLFAGQLLDDVVYTDVNGASLLSGDVWINVEGVQGPIHLLYHWCPGLSPGRWCASVEHASADVEMVLKLRGLDAVSFQDVQIRSLDLQAFGLAGGLVRGRVSGEIDRLDWRLADCPLLGIEQLQGSLLSTDIGLFGTATGAHRLDISTVVEGIDMDLEGDTFSGTVEIRGNQYVARGELVAPESMISMAQSLMRPLGGNRFGWQISGSLPC